ncbi:MAG TPA: pyridoxal-phosphate dependent enzyme [bacterium]|nr:pyridoxal-phosphate dependent enzyme [bacterium]HPQ66537.1 pyridoxal-phosphate dependent enzyme [bacterium]
MTTKNGKNAGVALRERLRPFPRLGYSLLPTPVMPLAGLSRRFGVEVWCKRDDLTGFAFGGNKTRKLDFLIAQALELGCDTLVAIGANQSNFCRMAAAYGTAVGLDVRLVLGGKDETDPTGNLRLDRILGASCLHIDSTSWEDWGTEAQTLEERLEREGRKVFRLPVGGSTPTGALGYVDAWAEILDDGKRVGIDFGTVVHSSSSAGTQAGLMAGTTLTGWEGTILGISAAHPGEVLAEEALALSRSTLELLGEPHAIPGPAEVDDGWVGPGYGIRTRECEEAVRRFAREYGIFLDYVYSGKAAAALLSFLEEGRFDRGEAVLFIHTGGNVELLA